MPKRRSRDASGARAAHPRSRAAPDAAAAPQGEWTRALLVAALAVAAYANTLAGALFFDDTNAILGNAWVRGGDPLAIFTHASWWAEGRGNAWRPLTTVSFWLNHALHGLAPAGYHAVNVLLHAGVSVLVLAVFRRVTAAPLAATIAALLFAVHPVHTEAVASVVGRAELLAAGGFLLAWLLLRRADGMRWARAGASTAAAAGGARLRTALLEGLAVAAFFCALLAKENPLVLPAVLVLADLLYPPAALTPLALLRRRLPRYGALVGAAAVYVALRQTLVGSGAPGLDKLDNPLVALAAGTRLLTAVKVVALYAWRLLVPLHLAADYSFDQIAPVASVLDPAFLVGLAVLIGVPLAAWWSRRRAPAVTLGLGFLVLTFAMVSNLVFPIGTIMAERLIYLPSAGFCLAAGDLLARAAAADRLTAPRLAVPLALVLALYGVRTWTRNAVWRDPLGFFTAMVADAPRSARSHRELGTVLADAGRFEEARRAFERSLAIKPGDAATLYNLGNALIREQRFDQAVEVYTQALAAKPNFADAMVNLGNAESLRGDHRAALTWMRRALDITPRSASLHMNVANELFHVGPLDEARSEYQAALALAPDSSDILVNYGAFLLAQGDHDGAIAAYGRAGSAAPMALVGLAASYRAKGMVAEARATQARAARLFSEHPAVRQMGEVLRRDGAHEAGS